MVNNIKNVILANDHAAVKTKFFIYEYLTTLNYNVINVGTDSTNSTHYPYYALMAANTLKKTNNSKAIILCSSGVGISLVANKIKGIRCMVCNNPSLAKIGREQFDINVLGLGANIIGYGLIQIIVDTFLNTEFNTNNISNVNLLNNMTELSLVDVKDPKTFFDN